MYAVGEGNFKKSIYSPLKNKVMSEVCEMSLD